MFVLVVTENLTQSRIGTRKFTVQFKGDLTSSLKQGWVQGLRWCCRNTWILLPCLHASVPPAWASSFLNRLGTPGPVLCLPRCSSGGREESTSKSSAQTSQDWHWLLPTDPASLAQVVCPALSWSPSTGGCSLDQELLLWERRRSISSGPIG